MKTFFISTLFIIFLLSGCAINNNEQKNMTHLNCLTEKNFKLALDYIRRNSSDNTSLINDWKLTAISEKELNRIAFSKSNGNQTLGFVLSEKESVEIASTIVLKKQNNKAKEEIGKAFCELIQKIKN